MNRLRLICSATAGSTALPLVLLLLVIVAMTAMVSSATAQVVVLPDAPPSPPGSLKDVPRPEPENLGDFVKNKAVAIKLGKALFWDMQVGSDGIQACASCHFHAGADSRAKNQLSPGLNAGDTAFGNNPFTGQRDFPDFGPNYTVKPEDFPFHKLADPADRDSTVLRDTNDVLSSQGVFFSKFIQIRPYNPVDLCDPLPDIFNVRGVNVRRVEPRNTPTTINAVFNYHNFWDGRASAFFNGINPFGPVDAESGVFFNTGSTMEKRFTLLALSSLASQAVGPPLSDFEMSCQGRTWAAIGKKMLTLRPLGKQLVHPHDSELGSLARTRLLSGKVRGLNGLTVSYEQLIKAAFKDELWNSSKIVEFNVIDDYLKDPSAYDPATYYLSNGVPVVKPRPNRALRANEYTQMEANFSFFFGLAVQLYEATLIADDSPFDRSRDSTPTYSLTAQEQLGFDVFMGKGRCINCHGGTELTNASVRNAQAPRNIAPPNNVVELMLMGDDNPALYDNGFYNIAVRPTLEDIGRGGETPFINPLTNQPFPLSFVKMADLKELNLLPDAVRQVTQGLPNDDAGNRVPIGFRKAVDGAFKTPALRNVELTGPYFHNGGQATLRQVVEFYDRGADFAELNMRDLDPDIKPIGLSEEEEEALVAFLLTLTDKRVKEETAPFDHPQLLIPNGSKGNQKKINGNCKVGKDDFRNCEEFFELKPVGKKGRPAEKLPNVGTFLGLSPFQK